MDHLYLSTISYSNFLNEACNNKDMNMIKECILKDKELIFTFLNNIFQLESIELIQFLVNKNILDPNKEYNISLGSDILFLKNVDYIKYIRGKFGITDKILSKYSDRVKKSAIIKLICYYKDNNLLDNWTQFHKNIWARKCRINGTLEDIKLLKSMGLDEKLSGSDFKSICLSRPLEIIKYLHENGYSQPIKFIINKNSTVDVVKYLANNNLMIHNEVEIKANFIRACYYGKLDIACYFLHEEKISDLAWIQICNKGNEKIIKLLLESELVDKDVKLDWINICNNLKPRILELLCEYGIKPDKSILDERLNYESKKFLRSIFETTSSVAPPKSSPLIEAVLDNKLGPINLDDFEVKKLTIKNATKISITKPSMIEDLTIIPTLTGEIELPTDFVKYFPNIKIIDMPDPERYGFNIDICDLADSYSEKLKKIKSLKNKLLRLEQEFE